jgi:hypothetical protein
MKDPNIIEVKFDVSTIKKIPIEVQREIFVGLQTKTTNQLAIEYGFDKRYKDLNQARSAVYHVYQQVCKVPEMYGVSEQMVDATRHAIEYRKSGAKLQVTKLDDSERINFIKDELGGIRDKTSKLISMKLDRALMSKKEREKLSIKDLASVLSTVIDKSRLLGGQSTENVLHYAKVAKDISPDEALSIVLKAREALQEGN